MDTKDTILASFDLIDEPRACNARHSLSTVLFCLLVGINCGVDGVVQAGDVAKAKKAFTRRNVSLKNGVPTHDTMARVLGMIDPDQFVVAFATMMSPLIGRTAGEIINIESKTLRGVTNKVAARGAAAEIRRTSCRRSRPCAAW